MQTCTAPPIWEWMASDSSSGHLCRRWCSGSWHWPSSSSSSATSGPASSLSSSRPKAGVSKMVTAQSAYLIWGKVENNKIVLKHFYIYLLDGQPVKSNVILMKWRKTPPQTVEIINWSIVVSEDVTSIPTIITCYMIECNLSRLFSCIKHITEQADNQISSLRSSPLCRMSREWDH